MQAAERCSECGSELSTAEQAGLCPRCLLSLGFRRRDLHESPGYFGDYELLEEVARGGMGVVYKARQISLDRIVALKLILSGRFADQSTVRRFRAEAAAAAKLQHPNIVAIHEVSEQNGQHFFSMDYVAGKNLAQSIRERPFAVREAACLLKALAHAIHYAHAQGIVHRDLKPSNILLDRAGEPRITDFGLAKNLGADADLTVTGQVLGSPNYISPEQAAGKSMLAPATDIYSLGAILYYVLTGRPPFAAETLTETLQQVSQQEPVSPRLLNASIPEDLETICLKCLEKHPQRRYHTANAVAEELGRYLDGEPIQARPIGPTERGWRWCKRNPVLAGSITTIFLMLLIMVVGATVAAWRLHVAHQTTRRERDRAQQSSQQRAHALRQMEAVQLGRAEEFFETGNRRAALPYWAMILRENPTHRLAAERLMSTLSHRNFARLACPPLMHSNRITSASFSRDGRWIVASDSDKTAWVWDADTGRRVAGPFRHEAEINSAEFSPNGELVVTAAQDGTARVWDARTQVPVTAPLVIGGDVVIARFSPNSRWIVAGGDKGTVHIWDIRTGERILGPLQHGGAVSDAELSPDNSRLATACHDSIARLWDAQTGQLLHQFMHSGRVGSIRFSPMGEWVVTSSWDGTARVWDVQTGQPVGKPLQHKARVWHAQFSPCGHRVATASGDRTAQVWDARTGEPEGPPLSHDAEVRSAVFSPEGRRIVTSSWDHTARVWETTTWQPLTEPMSHDTGIYWAEFHPDGQRLLTAGTGNAVLVWNVIGSPALLLPHQCTMLKCEWSPDNKHVLIGTWDTVNVFDALSCKLLIPALRHNGHVLDAQFSPDGTLLATASDDLAVRLWDINTGALLPHSLTHDTRPRAIRFSPDGHRLVAAAGESAVIWDIRSGQRLANLLGHEGTITSIQFSPDGTFVVTTSLDSTARIWHSLSGQPFVAPLQHQASVSSARFSPDSLSVATASDDQTARVWNVATGKLLRTLAHPNKVVSAQFSPNGEHLVTATTDFRVWDARTGQLLAGPFGSFLERSSVHFSPDSQRLIATARPDSKSTNDQGQVWDAQTGRRLSEGLSGGYWLSIRLSPDGRFLLTRSECKAEIWEITSPPLPIPPWLPDLAEALAGQRFDEQGVLEPVQVQVLWNVRQAATRTPATDFYGRWVNWFFADVTNRTVLPSSPLTLPHYAARLRDQHPSFENVIESLKIDPTNSVAIPSPKRL
jgi:WD40 repeat protein/predicted Ser/Thr protein kinase